MAGLFAGKVALVTGAGSGIGRASALAFSREGAQVVVADVNVAGGEETVALIKKAGGAALFVQSDVSRDAAVAALIERAATAFGRLDYAHNNAGILGARAMTADCSEEEWDRVVATNLKSIWLCMRYEIPRLLEQGGGAIVNTASAAGLVGIWGYPAYTASKHGVVGLTKTAAIEYVKAGIRVNAVCPGFIATPMVRGMTADDAAPQTVVPAGRLGKPEEVAEAVIWLCSDKASYVTGHMMAVDGALTAM